MTTPQVQLTFTSGATVWSGNQEYVVVKVVDLAHILARNLQTNALDVLPIAGLHAPPKSKDDAKPEKDFDLADVSSDDWDEAKARRAAVLRLLAPHSRGAGLAKKVADELGVSLPTLYAWRNDYLGSGLLSSLLPYKPEGGKGRHRNGCREDRRQHTCCFWADDHDATWRPMYAVFGILNR